MKKKSFKSKQSNFSLSVVLSHKGQPFRPQSFRPQPWLWARPFTPPTSLYLRYSHALPTASFLGHVSNQNSQQKSLYGQYRRNKIEASRAARIRCRGSENQSGRAEKRSGQICWRRWDAAPLRVTFCIWNHLNKAHRPEILLAKPQKRRWSLCQGLQHLFIV